MTEPVLGTCTACGAPIPRHAHLISYETASGVQMYAECPACGRVVHPERAD